MQNELLAKESLTQVWIASINRDETAFIKQRIALTNLLDSASDDARLKYRRESQYPVLDFQMPVVVFGNGNTEADHMNNYAVAKGTVER
jgi:hypothetical protein